MIRWLFFCFFLFWPIVYCIMNLILPQSLGAEAVSAIDPVRCLDFKGKINSWFPEKFLGFIDFQGRGELARGVGNE